MEYIFDRATTCRLYFRDIVREPLDQRNNIDASFHSGIRIFGKLGS